MNLIVDGRKVFAATGGRPARADQPCVVLIHGAGMDHSVWTLQSRFLAHHGRGVLALDLPGHGRSQGPSLASIDAMTDWLIRALDAAAIARAALVGHSMGALVALEAAARAPQRIWALALLGAAERMRVHRDLLAAAAAHEHLAIELIASWGLGLRAHFGGCRAPGQWMLGSAIRLLERCAPETLAADLVACDAYAGATVAAAKLRCPATLIAGDADRMTPPSGARALAQAMSEARLVTLAPCGHLMMIEQPDRALAALAEAV